MTASTAVGPTIRVAPLYRRLPRGPSALTPEQIARNQRARLYGAMIDSVARRGWESTTVADVIGLAGVSRRAFYEHCRDKDDCLRVAHHSVVGHARAQVIDGWSSQRGWANQLHAACKSLFDDVIEHPKGARFVLVDSLGITPRARERAMFASLVFEDLLHVAMRSSPGGAQVPRLSPCALVGGIRQAVFVRVREHREPELYTLADEVLDWIESYRSSRDGRLALPVRSVSAPAQQPAVFLAREDPRTRILSAAVRLILELGYTGFTDSQLARSARLPTHALHKQFPSKEACFLAVLDAFVQELLESAQAEMHHAQSWPTEVHHAITAYINYLVSHQALTQLAFVDLFDVGPAMIVQTNRPVEGLTKLLTDTGPAPQRGVVLAREAITGAISAVISSHATGDRVSRLPALVDQLTFIVLAPYIGAKSAADQILADRTSHAF